MADFPTAAVNRLAGYNGARYDAQTNPFGFAIGGHRVNFPASLNDSASVAAYMAATSQEVKDAATAVGLNLTATNTARDLAQKWASNPEDVVVSGGAFSALHHARKAAASAAAAATFDPALFAKLVGANFSGPVSTTKALAAAEGVRWGVGVAPSENDWNAVTQGGIYLKQNMANTPNGSASGHYVIVQRNDENHVSQTATNLFSGETFQRVRVGGTWGAWANLWSGTTSPLATDAEADAGSVVAPRMWSPARLWRAVRAALPLVTQSVAEVGTDTVARSWSALRVAQAIRATLPAMTQAIAEAGTDVVARSVSALTLRQSIESLGVKGVAVAGAAGGTVVGGSSTALAGGDFTAVGPVLLGHANLSVEGSTSTVVRARLNLYRITDGALIKEGAQIAIQHQGTNLERLPLQLSATDLVRGTAYRLRVFASADTAQVNCSSLVDGINA